MGFEDRLTSRSSSGATLLNALHSTGRDRCSGWGGCSVPNSHLSPFSLGHSSFTKLASKAALVEVIGFLKVEAFPG